MDVYSIKVGDRFELAEPDYLYHRWLTEKRDDLFAASLEQFRRAIEVEYPEWIRDLDVGLVPVHTETKSGYYSYEVTSKEKYLIAKIRYGI